MPREQDQFLDVVSPSLAVLRWREAAPPRALGSESLPIADALDRILFDDVVSPIDVPGFDRSNLDGYAVRAEDTYGSAEETPNSLRLNTEELATGIVPGIVVAAGTATPISTGGMLPRGADAVAMVEITSLRPDGTVLIKKPVAPGQGVTFAGTDLARGELALRRGERITSREVGVLAALGLPRIEVVRRPRVAILSTGDEIVEPGDPLPLGSVHDSNAAILAASVREEGGEPVRLGIVADDEAKLSEALDQALAMADLVILSGGTSKGAGDLSYRVLSGRSPGIVVHGVALKPGKPVCLGAVGDTPVAILPGFPTSAVFTFHEFVAPRIHELAGRRAEDRETTSSTLAMRVNSDRGRLEYVLVHLVPGESGLAAYPMGKGSGSVTAFSRADGFFSIPEVQEFAAEGERIHVTTLGAGRRHADLTVIGSHCVGLDLLLGVLATQGITSKTIWVGSQGGLSAAGRGECDLAGIHLLDEKSDIYNASFLPAGVRLLGGYGRMQGIVSRPGDVRFADRGAFTRSLDDPTVAMVNRNRGSGTRVLIDGLLAGRKPPGYSVEVRSHNAVCAAVSQGRADWGVAISQVAREYGLLFVPLRQERYDFAVPESRWDRPAVAAFRAVLADEAVRFRLASRGFLIGETP
jgi:putative molybdopterin biosynthesis protein